VNVVAWLLIRPPASIISPLANASPIAASIASIRAGGGAPTSDRIDSITR
jgi:hypothetical protein